MQASSFGKCENEMDEIRKGTYLALQQRQGPDAERLLGKEMTSFFNDKCLSSIAHKHSLSGEDGWGRTTSSMLSSLRNRDTFLLWQTPLQVPIDTCLKEALEQVGEFSGRSC